MCKPWQLFLSDPHSPPEKVLLSNVYICQLDSIGSIEKRRQGREIFYFGDLSLKSSFHVPLPTVVRLVAAVAAIAASTAAPLLLMLLKQQPPSLSATAAAVCHSAQDNNFKKNTFLFFIKKVEDRIQPNSLHFKV